MPLKFNLPLYWCQYSTILADMVITLAPRFREDNHHRAGHSPTQAEKKRCSFEQKPLRLGKEPGIAKFFSFSFSEKFSSHLPMEPNTSTYRMLAPGIGCTLQFKDPFAIRRHFRYANRHR